MVRPFRRADSVSASLVSDERYGTGNSSPMDCELEELLIGIVVLLYYYRRNPKAVERKEFGCIFIVMLTYYAFEHRHS